MRHSLKKAINMIACLYPSDRVLVSDFSLGLVKRDDIEQLAFVHQSSERFTFIYFDETTERVSYADAGNGRLLKLYHFPREGKEVSEENFQGIRILIIREDGDIIIEY